MLKKLLNRLKSFHCQHWYEAVYEEFPVQGMPSATFRKHCGWRCVRCGAKK